MMNTPAAPPATWAAMNTGGDESAIPANVSENMRPTVIAGLAKLMEAVNQQAAPMQAPTAAGALARRPPRARPPGNSASRRRGGGMRAVVTAASLTRKDSSVKLESMNFESNSDLDRRAAMHAALADPARLRITDMLADGDASPSELAAVLAMPSNLLAHHLGVLGEAGLLTRHRSEGDRRRTYLHLVPGALDALSVPPARPAPRVLFVCTANSARSHLAAALWRRASKVPVASAGTRPAAAIDPGAVAAARRNGVPMRRLRPRHIDEVREDRDLVITVCDLAHEELGEPSAVHWSVPDPAPSGDEASFDAAVNELARRVGQFAPRLRPAS